MEERPTYPVRLEGRLDDGLSRWLWLVKWLLAIPHYVVLFFLWLAFLALTVVAFFAILFTARYPKGIFAFNLGVLRWTWRVGYYSYAALGTDRYPPFTLDDVPDYPARLDIAYPKQLSRGLVLVKWWLLAIPHYMLLGVFLGASSYAASKAADGPWAIGLEIGLAGLLVLFAAVALLFTTRYPWGMFDFVLGVDRWIARVAAYVFLMTDQYPPFRLDQGGDDPVGVAPDAPAQVVAPEPEAAPAGVPAAGGRGARIALVVLGTVAAIVATGLLAGGCALVAVDQAVRDDDGFVMSPDRDLRTPTYAIVSERAELDTDGAEWALDAFLGTVRIRAESESRRELFIGIGREDAVTAFLRDVEHDVVTHLDEEPTYTRQPGRRPARGPGASIWAAAASGVGEQTLEWEPEDGDWRAVVMNADGSRGVSAEVAIGAELDSLLWIGIGLLVVGGLLAAAGALAITAGVRGRRAPPTTPLEQQYEP
jgi:Domain of unknown function (DUF4389)